MNYKKEIKELKARVEKLENPEKHENLENHGKITLKEFFDSDEPLAIYCETKEQAKKLCTAFDKMGKKWILGESYAKRQDLINANSCYANDATWGDRKEFEEDFKVYDFEDVIIPKWSFTEDEKVILRNLPEEYKWIARDEDDILCCFKSRYKPNKDEFFGIWSSCSNASELRPFNHLFQCIKWEDDEPCEFRRFL